MIAVGVPRVSASKDVPATANSASTKPSAAGRSRLGAKPPEVTDPTGLSLWRKITLSRTGRAPLADNPTRRRFGPVFNSSIIRAAPGKSAASRRFFEIAKLRPASTGVMV